MKRKELSKLRKALRKTNYALRKRKKKTLFSVISEAFQEQKIQTVKFCKVLILNNKDWY